MHIYGASQVHGPQSLQGPHWNRAAAPASGTQAAADIVDISAAAEAAMTAAEGGDIRADLVARVRSQIASGSYDTPDKMAIALDSMFDELA
jgi:anti-sigma28 factor (negative regulator of flagellin synthesis)